MSAEQKCPKCGSENTHFIKKRQVYECEEATCKHEFSLETFDRRAKRQRIFLSYGHDENAELVERIKADLENLGHDVWIDSSEIKFGDDWRRSITDGIRDSKLMLSFLSEHSTRNPSVCLDELSIALGTKSGIVQTILVESEQEVTPPVSVSHIQWLDMHDWRDHWDHEKNEPLKDGWYENRLAEIRRVVESEANERFAGEIETLRNKLEPVTMDAFTAGLLQRGFTGRKWLAEQLWQWAADPDGGRAFVLTGKPGIGKSAFSAWLAHYNKTEILAAVFVRYTNPASSDPRRIASSIAFQLATRLPDYRKLLVGLPELDDLNKKTAAELFTFLLTEPLRYCIDGGRSTGFILIDALDESQLSGSAGIADLLARHAEELPQWLRVFATTRPGGGIQNILSHLRPRSLDADDSRNRKDIADYFEHELAVFNPRSDVIDALVEKTEGVFLYAKYVSEEVRKNRLSLERLDEFPKGLGGIYTQFFKRQFPDIDKYRKEILPALQVVLAAVETVQRTDLETVFGWGDTDSHTFVFSMGSLFTEADGRIEPFHSSLKEWLTSRTDSGTYYVSIKDGHRRLAMSGWMQVKQLLTERVSEPTLNYSCRFAGVHLYASKDMNKELRELFNSAVKIVGEGKSGYEEILGNLLDWVVRRKEFSGETFLKEIINGPLEEDCSHKIADFFSGKAATFERIGVTSWALFFYEKNLKIMKALVEKEPEKTDYQWDLSRSFNEVGHIYKVLGENGKALEYNMKAVKIMESLVNTETKKPDYKSDLLLSLDTVDRIVKEHVGSSKAFEGCKRVIKIIDALVEREPERADNQYKLSQSFDSVGDIYKDLGKSGKALECYMKGMRITEALVEKEPEKTDYQFALSFSFDNVGGIYEALGESGKALECYMKSITIMEALVEKEPEKRDYHYGLSFSFDNVGSIYEALGESSKALEYYMKGMNIMEALVEREPERTDLLELLAISYWRSRNIMPEEIRQKNILRVYSIVEELRAKGMVHGPLERLWKTLSSSTEEG